MSGSIDEVARDLARKAENKADAAAVAGDTQWKEARRDFDRLESSVKEGKIETSTTLGSLRTEVTARFDKIADNQRTQFIAIITLLGTILLGIILRAIHVFS